MGIEKGDDTAISHDSAALAKEIGREGGVVLATRDSDGWLPRKSRLEGRDLLLL